MQYAVEARKHDLSHLLNDLALRVFCCAIALALLAADSRAQNGAAGAAGPKKPVSPAGYNYRFENKRFYIPLIEIDLDPEGTGEVRFKRGESDDIIDLKLKVLPATMGRIRDLFGASGFLISTEEYQSKKDFAHMGAVTLAASDGERERKALFNHTENVLMKELADIFRALATQQIHLFDLETSQQYQPLDLPRQLESLESDLRLSLIAEPEQVLPALRELADSDITPLIARNKAKMIAKDIEKGKYKSPLKKK